MRILMELTAFYDNNYLITIPLLRARCNFR